MFVPLSFRGGQADKGQMAITSDLVILSARYTVVKVQL